jgi:DNA polymerase III epsilon subunit-like protein
VAETTNQNSNADKKDKKEQRIKRMFWVDLEMTGLDEIKDRILEIAVIIRPKFSDSRYLSPRCVSATRSARVHERMV